MIRIIIAFTTLLISTSNIVLSKQRNYIERAISAMEIGLYEESLKQLERALSLEPGNAQIYKLKALLYEAINENQNAINSWNKCIQTSKDQNLIKEAKVHLDYLNGF